MPPKPVARATPARVLHVIPTLGYGGVSQMLLNYYRHIDRTSVQFDIYCHAHSEEHVTKVKDLGGRVVVSDTMGRLGARRYLGQLGVTIKKYGPYAAIHIHTNYQAGPVALAARMAGVPIRICHVHGVHIDEGNRRLLRLYQLLIRINCNVRLACSVQAGQFYYGRSPFRLIPNAIDLSLYEQECDASQCRTDLGVNGYRWVLGHVGRFSEEKNHVFLLRVLQALRNEGEDACLVCVGDGPTRPAISRMAIDLGIDRHLRFLGQRADVPALLHAFDALLLPSHSEGMPICIMEAQAARVPSIVSGHLTRDCDLGLGLVKFASLEHIDAWVSAIRATRNGTTPHAQDVWARMRDEGLDVRRGARELATLYGTLVNA